MRIPMLRSLSVVVTSRGRVTTTGDAVCLPRVRS